MRDERVILDIHLAELYGVETRVLKQAVKRNIERFPDDFMFELNDDEIDEVVSQNVIPSKSYFGGANPYAFTETGVAMLSSVLKSSKAVEMNIAIMRTFVALRKLAINYDELLKKLEAMEKGYDGKFKEIYNT
ncbi:MAG: ORF6N domain-containing protein [Saprospiraceae bacterium]|nr:ORF6N domain-containing protein [Saprospiraceae bacterium]